MVESEQVAVLTEEERGKALQRLEFLRPFLEKGVPLSHVALYNDVPLRTLQRWLARYYQDGLAGLTRKPRADRGKRRYIVREVQHVIESLALSSPSPTAAFVHRHVTQLANQQGWRAPSYRAVAAIMRTYTQNTKKNLKDRGIINQQTVSTHKQLIATRPNELWQVFRTQLGIFVLSERGNPIHPWLTLIMDAYSGAIAGYLISYQHSPALTTALALRQGIWYKDTSEWFVCGIPEQLYVDYDQTFSTPDLEQVSKNLNMQLMFPEPGKHYFQQSVKGLIDALVKHFVRTFPMYVERGHPQQTAVEMLALLDEHFLGVLGQVYHTQPRPGTDELPQQLWLADGFTPRLPQSLNQLDPLLVPVPTPRRVHRNGIYFRGILYADIALANLVGELVRVRYDPRDASHVWVYWQNKFVCHATLTKVMKRSTRIASYQNRQEDLNRLRHVF